MSQFEEKRIAAYFSHLSTRLGRVSDAACICVAHMVPNTRHFLPAVQRSVDLGLVLQKPKSVGRPEAKWVAEHFRTRVLDRDWAADPQSVAATLKKVGLDNRRLVIADIGGYFASSVDEIADRIPGEIVGVMEGTENGAVDYEAHAPTSIPVVTVARSRLKLPEDYLVASSVVFSIEALLREEAAQILQTRTACVIGYGRVGSAVADILRHRGLPTVVHDTHPVAIAEAAARGFPVHRRIETALESASLVVCATGDSSVKAIDAPAMHALRPGSVVTSVTSSDTTIDEEALGLIFGRPRKVSSHIKRYDAPDDRYFWLLDGGDAVNFVHGAVVGPAIQLIEGEKLAAITRLAAGVFSGRQGQGLLEVDEETRMLVANIWNEHFVDS